MGQRSPYLAPDWFLSRIMNPILMKVGVVPTLRVRGRRSGQWRAVPVNVLELDGSRYLVSARGETEWVRNIRVNESCEVHQRGGVLRFRAVEIADDEKPPIIAAYLDRWRSQVAAIFAELPNPADHPVFRLEPVT